MQWKSRRLRPDIRSRYAMLGIGHEWAVLVGREKHLKAGGVMAPHHHGWEARFLIRGEQPYELAERVYRVRAGEVFVTLPGELHSTAGMPHQGCEYYLLKIFYALPGRLFLDLPHGYAESLERALHALPSRHFRGSRRLRELFESTTSWGLREGREPMADVIAYSHMLELFLEIVHCSRRKPRTSRSRWTEEILAFLQNNLHRPMGVPEMAEHMHMSPGAFQMRFRREIGAAPADFFLRSKIALARSLLRRADNSVVHVAAKLGFSTSQYFAAVFRRCTGLPPSAYRPSSRRR